MKMGTLKRFLLDESGATAIEYGMVAALISIGLLASAKLMGTDINDKFSQVGTQVSAAGDAYLDK